MPGVTVAFQTGNHAGRPAASAGCILYSCTDHGLVYRSDGTTWTTWATLGSVGGSAWTAYTPTWACAGTAPALGNGTLIGRYKLIDAATCIVEISFTAGSTTTFGTGQWSFSLPFTAASNLIQVLSAFITDSGTDNLLAVATIPSGGTTISQIIGEGTNVVTNTTPMTWTTNDSLRITGIYERV